MGASTLDRLADELVKNSANLPWPTDKPEVRQSWVDAVQRNPSRLAEEAAAYEKQVKDFLYNLSDLGGDIMKASYEPSVESVFKVRDGIRAYSEARKAERTLMHINAILNVSQEGSTPSHLLRGIARNKLVYAEGFHDSSTLVSPFGLYGVKEFEENKQTFGAIGKHAFNIGWGGANMLVHGPTRDVYLTEEIGVIDSLLNRNGKSIEIQFTHSTDVHFEGDNNNLYRCLFNLANNALLRGKATKLRISATQTDSQVSIEVADNGIGLPNEDQVFEYGVTNGQGKGIGLYLTRTVVLAHDGTITAKAHNDDPIYKGAVFRLTLPKSNSGPVHYKDRFF